MEAAQINPEPEAQVSSSKYYTWEAPGKKTSVQIDFNVVDRLMVEVMRGFGAIPRRGAEVGGILLGTAEVNDRITVRIDDFAPVLCEHKRGPSYLLSDGDVARFAETLARHRYSPDKSVYAVGWYRSHTRDGGLSLSADDMAHLESYFPDISDVVLLVKPYATRVSLGAIFFREEDGRMRTESSYLEFPFRRKELGGGSAPARPRDPLPGTATLPVPIPRAAVVEEVEAATPEVIFSEAPGPVPGFAAGGWNEVAGRRRNVWIPLSFLALALGGLIGFQASTAFRPEKTATAVTDVYNLGLTAARSGDYLLVRWDRNAATIKLGQRGVLRISEGGHEKDVELDSLQLQNPQVFYRNLGDRVKLRLEVFPRERNSVSETFEWRK